MTTELQKASLLKRTAAGIFDFILVCVLAVGIAWFLSWVLGADAHQEKWDKGRAAYEQQYGVTYDITQEEYDALSEQKRQNYDAAHKALVSDKEVMQSYNMVVQLAILTVTFGILIAQVLLELVVPLILKNGQTIGKKIFSIALVRVDGVKLSTLQLFVRTVLAKFTLETMIPVYFLVMLFFNAAGIFATVIIGGLTLAQLICLCVTKTNSLIHDLLSGTVAVDMATQMIFRSTDDLIRYQQRVHAEQVARSTY